MDVKKTIILPESNGNGNGDWKKWGMHVLMELERNEKTHDKLDGKLDKIHDDLLMLKTKATVWGSVGGGLFGFITGILLKIFG